MLATDVHAIVTGTQSGFERNFHGSEFTGIDEYLVRKMKAASLIEPESVPKFRQWVMKAMPS